MIGSFRSPLFPARALLALLVALASGQPTLARHREMMNSVYFEYGGTAILYSLNYDRTFFKIGDWNSVGARVGFSWLPFDKQVLDVEQVFVTPVTLNYICGKAPHYGELGLGVAARTFINPGIITTKLFPAFSIGYRARAKGSGMLFRADFTPVFFNGFMPWFGVSLGRAF
jgi:hypothetical protein